MFTRNSNLHVWWFVVLLQLSPTVCHTPASCYTEQDQVGLENGWMDFLNNTFVAQLQFRTFNSFLGLFTTQKQKVASKQEAQSFMQTNNIESNNSAVKNVFKLIDLSLLTQPNIKYRILSDFYTKCIVIYQLYLMKKQTNNLII